MIADAAIDDHAAIVEAGKGRDGEADEDATEDVERRADEEVAGERVSPGHDRTHREVEAGR
jgi:hypothetical protein